MITLAGNIIINEKKEILLLYRKKWKAWETPGGKVDCENPEFCTVDELETEAKRELYEEIGSDVNIETMKYFGHHSFTIPDGREAVAHKFIVRISGKPKVNEPEIFSDIKWIPITKLNKEPISLDLQLFIEKIKNELL